MIVVLRSYGRVYQLLKRTHDNLIRTLNDGLI